MIRAIRVVRNKPLSKYILLDIIMITSYTLPLWERWYDSGYTCTESQRHYGEVRVKMERIIIDIGPNIRHDRWIEIDRIIDQIVDDGGIRREHRTAPIYITHQARKDALAELDTALFFTVSVACDIGESEHDNPHLRVRRVHVNGEAGSHTASALSGDEVDIRRGDRRRVDGLGKLGGRW